ncbi:MAG TPA: TlpA disulfide reductase family protein [Cytophagaceae bacterium]|jgi:peroxiredoxin
MIARYLSIFALITSSLIGRANVKVGDKAPDISIQDPSGKVIQLSALQGQIVLVDFWASWCGPCRANNPELVKLYNKYHSSGFEIFSVSLDKEKAAWVKAIEKDQLTWKSHGCDLKEWNSKHAINYGIEAIPSTFLVNEKGIIIAIDLDEYDIEKKLDKIFSGQVNFFPTKTSSKIYFTQKVKYEIKDVKEKIVSTGTADSVDLSDLANGLYKLKYKNRSEVFEKIAVTPLKPEIDLTNWSIKFPEETSFEIFNKKGMRMMKGTGLNTEISSLSPGDYFLSFRGNSMWIKKK